MFFKLNGFAFMLLLLLLYSIIQVLKEKDYYEIMAMPYKLSRDVNLTQKN